MSENIKLAEGLFADLGLPLSDLKYMPVIEQAIEAARQEGYAECCKGVDTFTDATNAEVRDLRRQLAAAQALVSDAADRLCGHDWLPRSVRRLQSELRRADTTAIDTLLAAKERETIERCAKICELALSSAWTTPADCLYAIRAMLKNETSCTQS